VRNGENHARTTSLRPTRSLGRPDAHEQMDSSYCGTPFLTCAETFRIYSNVIGVAVSQSFDPAVPGGTPLGAPDGAAPEPSGEWLSWIEIGSFGGAEQLRVPAEQREPISPTFKVEYGTRIHVSAFRLVIEDERVWAASERFEPIPRSAIGGVLEGFIDFDLDRGRAAQAFP
jgi:hypothetical protein